MRTFKGLVAAIIAAGVLFACGGGDVPGTLVSFLEIAAPAGVVGAGKSYSMVYRMLGAEGEVEEATAIVMVPSGTAPAGGWPVVAWGHGTTGIADACAPSAIGGLAGYYDVASGALAEGFAVIAPDYEGLGAPDGHPYLNLSSEGRSLVSAARAARFMLPGELSRKWAAMGHSQGGHAVLGAAQYAHEAVGMTYVGTAAFAPASNIKAISDATFAQIAALTTAGDFASAAAVVGQQTYFSVLVATSMKITAPSFSTSEILGASADALVPTAKTESPCGTFSAAVSSSVATHLATGGAPTTYAGLKADYYSNGTAKAFIDGNEPGLVALGKPVLLLQGDADSTVPKFATDTLKTTMLGLGTDVSYTVYAGVNHSGVVAAGLPTALSFLGTQFAATP